MQYAKDPLDTAIYPLLSNFLQNNKFYANWHFSSEFFITISFENGMKLGLIIETNIIKKYFKFCKILTFNCIFLSLQICIN